MSSLFDQHSTLKGPESCGPVVLEPVEGFANAATVHNVTTLASIRVQF